MARLLGDENFPRPVVVELTRFGHDVLGMEQTGLTGQGLPDAAVLAFAAADGRAVLTLDRGDFHRLHRTGRDHAGIIACTQDLDFERMAARIHAVISKLERLDGQFIRSGDGVRDGGKDKKDKGGDDDDEDEDDD